MSSGSGETQLFGARLRTARLAAGISQEELAERAGLSVRAIGDLERGRTRRPYPRTLRVLADALGISDPSTDQAEPSGVEERPDRSTPVAGRDTSAVPRQLPPGVGHFTGRTQELATLSTLSAQALRDGTAVVITAIAGTAGVGKTALAVCFSHQVAEQFPDGQLHVNLRGFDPAGTPLPPAAAIRRLLDALDVPAQRIPTELDAQTALYRTLLAGRRMLILLDNARDTDQVRPLLPGTPGCLVIVTSRNLLADLIAVEGAVPLTVDLLTRDEARELLERRLGPDRVAGEPTAVDQLIDLCAGLPLALNITASRVITHPGTPLGLLAARLRNTRSRLDVFSAGVGTANLRAVLSWSYQTLTAPTARMFRLLGAHPGPDISVAAAASLAAVDCDQARNTLDELTAAHLLTEHIPGRYGMHDLLRGYAGELAGDLGEDGRAALTRLFDHYLYTAATAMDSAFPAERHRRPRIPVPDPRPPVPAGEAAALEWLAVELPSLVAVTGYAAEHGWPGHTVRLSATLFRYLDSAARFPEAITVHDHARRAACRTGDRTAEANALVSLGVIDGHQGRHHQATGYLEQALSRYRETGDRDGQARALNYLGLVHRQQGRYQQATDELTQALNLFRAVGEHTGEGHALSNLGAVDLEQGRYRQAIDHQQQALALFRQIGDRHAEALVLTRCGLIALRQDRYQQAASQIQQALDHYHDVGDRQGEASALASLGRVGLRQGHYHRAAGQLRQALTWYREMSDPSGQSVTLNSLGDLFLATGRLTDARTQYASALRLAVQIGAKYEQARAHDGLATAHQASGVPAKARHHWQQALALYIDLGAPETQRIRAHLTVDGHLPTSRPTGSLST